MSALRTRRRVIVDDSPLAAAIGARIRRARHASGLTQQQLAGERYTKAYISALENGLAKPSMAALNFLAPRLGTTASALLTDPDVAWRRIEADLYLASGAFVRAIDACVDLLERTEAPARRAELLLIIAESHCRLEHPGAAIRPAAEAARLFEAAGRETDRASAEYWLASAHYQTDNLAEARSLLAALLNRIRGGVTVAPDFMTRLLVAAAMVETSGGAPQSAIGYLEEARALGADLDDRRRGLFLSTLANAHREAGDLEGAITLGLQALALMRSAQAEIEVGQIENLLAMSYLANGSAERAADLAAAARQAATASGDRSLQSYVSDTEAQIALAMGDPEAAVDLAGEALALARETGTDKAVLDALVTRARAYAALGRHAEASDDFERAARTLKPGQRPTRRREILSAWADALAALGKHDQAFALAREALGER
ncbi:MAG TPA: helix-turn-helix transcriptional regulator [Clostridia bacterium]|nr:helix-turn-helix transcriptional regulator [Clostridia bacterium]